MLFIAGHFVRTADFASDILRAARHRRQSPVSRRQFDPRIVDDRRMALRGDSCGNNDIRLRSRIGNFRRNHQIRDARSLSTGAVRFESCELLALISCLRLNPNAYWCGNHALIEIWRSSTVVERLGND